MHEDELFMLFHKSITLKNNFQLKFTLTPHFSFKIHSLACFGVAIHHYMFVLGAVIAVVHLS